ncbi:MAG TPA: hypothetical protein DCG75_17620 [Bacteroidales bacterium]|nr:hypothetical protein [Bacteroidales bacterium]
MDFTLNTYKQLVNTLQKQAYVFQTFQEFINRPSQPLTSRNKSGTGSVGDSLPLGNLAKRSHELASNKRAGEGQAKTIILRHDVDKLPENSLRFAQIQHELGIKGSYYFRMVPESYDPEIIEKIAKLGHEIGYHYEDVDLAAKMLTKQETRNKKQETEKLLAEKAIQLFDKHLKELRRFYPIKTICMHGSPLSRYDNKLLWKYYNYRDYGIIGEPYFDVDFSKVLYLTDTGRRWDGEKVSIRDKVKKERRDTTFGYKRENSINFLSSPQPPEGGSPLGDLGARNSQSKRFKTTFDIIKAVEKRELPNQIMFTFHPQRWTNGPAPWIKEFVWQNTKNVVKYFLNRIRE